MSPLSLTCACSAISPCCRWPTGRCTPVWVPTKPNVLRWPVSMLRMISARLAWSLVAARREPRAVGVDRELDGGQQREAGVERDDRLGASGDGAGRVYGVVGS